MLLQLFRLAKIAKVWTKIPIFAIKTLFLSQNYATHVIFSEMLDSETIKRLAYDAGFDLCGIARCRHLADNERHFRDWLAQGFNARLDYLERNLDKRFDPRRLVDGALTAVVCAVSYKNAASEGYPDTFPTKVASYACTADYHDTIRAMLRTMLDGLKHRYPALAGRAFVDTAPLLEKQLAAEAGLGWIGRQSLLVTPGFGSFILLGELVLCDECDRYDTPFAGSRCGSCRRCIESCPAGAIGEERMIDARRCISCHTIEREPDTQVDLHGWIFGCDCCQSCCPYNRKAPRHRNPAFDPLFDPLAMTPETWRSLDDAEFARRFGGTPMTRSGRERIVGNIRDEGARTPGRKKAAPQEDGLDLRHVPE